MSWNRKLSAFIGCAAIVFLGLVGCATIDASSSPDLDVGARWALLPFSNATETPLAGQRAESVALSLAQSMGIGDIQRYPQSMQDESLLEPGQAGTEAKALAWARELGARYALTGTVQEWRYKVGVDGEPAVGVMMQVIDVSSGRVLWTAVGARTGWSRQSLAAVAQELMRSLLRRAL